MNPARPILSLVLTGRNDNHNGDFDWRAEQAIRHNASVIEALGLDVEWVWVEWNPLPDRPLFAAQIAAWVAPLSAYVVPAALHRHLCDNPHIGVMQFLAKNVGIRRARGEWILSMNADTYLTPEVLRAWINSPRDPATCYLARRLDFDSRHLSTELSDYPIPDLAQRHILRVSEIRLPGAFGSAGDFTLMHRDLFLKTRGHYEGIRFSNNHLDTLLGKQVLAMGGTFQVLGDIYHADHADSWNNFTVDDVFAHHHGADYNCTRIPIPYTNEKDWGLAWCQEKPLPSICVELAPPPGFSLRPAMPTTILIPPELEGVAHAAKKLAEALREVIRLKQRVVIYGLGDQLRQSLLKDKLSGLEVAGYLDDGRPDDPALPYRKLTWDELPGLSYDALLLGSFYWAEELRAKAVRHVTPSRILPGA